MPKGAQQATDHDDVVLQAALAEEAEAKAEAEQAAKKTDEPAATPPAPSTPESTETDGDETPEEVTPPAETPSEPKPDETPKEEVPADDPNADPAKAEGKQTRQERRAERRRSFLESIREEAPPGTQPIQRPEYQPVDYAALEGAEDPINPDALAQDRELFGDNRFAEGVELERAVAQQEQFWDRLDYQRDLIDRDPKFAFMNPESDDYDEDKAGTINELYLATVGYKESPVVDTNGVPVVDQQTGQQRVSITVDRPNYRYDKFVENLVTNVDRWAEQRASESDKNLATAKANQGTRPGGGSRKAKQLDPSAIKNMSNEEFQENLPEIEAMEQEAVAALGLD